MPRKETPRRSVGEVQNTFFCSRRREEGQGARPLHLCDVDDGRERVRLLAVDVREQHTAALPGHHQPPATRSARAAPRSHRVVAARDRHDRHGRSSERVCRQSTRHAPCVRGPATVLSDRSQISQHPAPGRCACRRGRSARARRRPPTRSRAARVREFKSRSTFARPTPATPRPPRRPARVDQIPNGGGVWGMERLAPRGALQNGDEVANCNEQRAGRATARRSGVY